jgi:GH24 family phage-related lysozyme (muramidase)
MDGISGVKIYNEINVNTRFLPRNYPKNLRFIIKGVNHKLSDSDWETIIETVTISKSGDKNVTPLPYSRIKQIIDGLIEDVTLYGTQSSERINTSTPPVSTAGVGGIFEDLINLFSGEDDFDTKLALLLRNYEGYRSKAYEDSKGIPTIGIGATWYPPGFRLKGKVQMGQTITEQEAIEIKAYQVKSFRKKIINDLGASEYSKVPDNVKAALESKVFNYGNLGSPLIQLVKNGIKTRNYTPVAAYFRKTLAPQNNGINSWRRNDEAGIIETGYSKRAKITFNTSI